MDFLAFCGVEEEEGLDGVGVEEGLLVLAVPFTLPFVATRDVVFAKPEAPAGDLPLEVELVVVKGGDTVRATPAVVPKGWLEYGRKND